MEKTEIINSVLKKHKIIRYTNYFEKCMNDAMDEYCKDKTSRIEELEGLLKRASDHYLDMDDKKVMEFKNEIDSALKGGK